MSINYSPNPVSNLLIQWYGVHRRELPWRETKDPYLIWISEIILQQTRVNQGLDYYYRFIERFPDVVSLADADEDEVMKYWQALGYYSRARNLHKAAKKIKTEYAGVFPRKFVEVLGLPGVGIYTASAICSFANNQPHAVVDGNVYRVLSRLFNIDTPIDIPAGQKIFSQLAEELLDQQNPGLHNQAIMEFGALHCVPSNPDCESCPLRFNCLSFAEKNQMNLPVKSLKIKVKERFFNYLHIQQEDHTFIYRREGEDIWKMLWEYPVIEEKRLLTVEELITHPAFREIFEGCGQTSILSVSPPVKHILTHQRIMAQVFSIKIASTGSLQESFKMIRKEDIRQYAVSRLMQIFIENHLA